MFLTNVRGESPADRRRRIFKEYLAAHRAALPVTFGHQVCPYSRWHTAFYVSLGCPRKRHDAPQTSDKPAARCDESSGLFVSPEILKLADIAFRFRRTDIEKWLDKLAEQRRDDRRWPAPTHKHLVALDAHSLPPLGVGCSLVPTHSGRQSGHLEMCWCNRELAMFALSPRRCSSSASLRRECSNSLYAIHARIFSSRKFCCSSHDIGSSSGILVSA